MRDEQRHATGIGGVAERNQKRWQIPQRQSGFRDRVRVKRIERESPEYVRRQGLTVWNARLVGLEERDLDGC